ncbi:hypothetical protein [Amycolatopsis sp. CA-128772]|uniref:hypothetical protein n=1 Tax=Amycolatopsis sp. CA-128772 TaxID=2073159 RepID=UPI001E30EF27|nr:hypothetical protein [Amycolatopsis sp. CA-128772]
MLTGVATRFDLLCGPCAELPAPELIDACVGCFDCTEVLAHLGWRGAPEILLRDRELAGAWATRPCPVRPLNDRCLAPHPEGWLALTEAGFVRIDDEDQWLLGPVVLPEERDVERNDGPDRPRGPVLHVPDDGRFAAIVSDYGQYGTVVDLAEWVTVLDLDRDWDDNEWTRFPFAFLDGDRFVAATDSNRLDVFEAATGRLLTERSTTREDNPEHYLGYCFGAMLPSPSGRSLLTDGWAWHPVGIPLVIDCAAWLAGDRHAPEHGRHLVDRGAAWDTPMAWLNENTVALQGIGVPLLDGIELRDATTGHHIGSFAGPKGRMWAHDGLLYVAAEAGLGVWDPAEGARIGLLEGFAPIAHREGTFAELRNDQLRTWATPR